MFCHLVREDCRLVRVCRLVRDILSFSERYLSFSQGPFVILSESKTRFVVYRERFCRFIYMPFIMYVSRFHAHVQ